MMFFSFFQRKPYFFLEQGADLFLCNLYVLIIKLLCVSWGEESTPKYKTCILFSPRDMLKIEELCEYSFSKNFYCTVLFAIFAKKRKRWKV